MSDITQPDFWDEKYEANTIPWDLGRPTPVFTRLARDGVLQPGRMIILGAGSGHDAAFFAGNGYEVTAVDFAPAAAAAMRARQGPGTRFEVFAGDMFTLPATLDGTFDYVLEYVCYCAIPPAQRDEYVALVRRLLRPAGEWVALAFPIGQRSGGPPYVVQPDQVITRFRQAGFTVVRREWPPESVPERKGVEQLLILQKRETIVLQ